MQESDTYLMILDEGQEKRAHKYILIAGEERVGPADESSKSQIESVSDLDRLDQLAGRPSARVPHLSIEPDRAALARLGLSAADVLLHVEAACGGHPIAPVRRGERRIEAVVRLRDACKDLPALRVGAGAVPLAAVARLRRELVPAEIRRAGGVRFVEIRGRRPAPPLPAGYAIVIPSPP